MREYSCAPESYARTILAFVMSALTYYGSGVFATMGEHGSRHVADIAKIMRGCTLIVPSLYAGPGLVFHPVISATIVSAAPRRYVFSQFKVMPMSPGLPSGQSTI